jgi:hypothetical protein
MAIKLTTTSTSLIPNPFLLYAPGRSDVNETVFWSNYFYHCDRVKKEHFCLVEENNDDIEDDEYERQISAEERSEVEDFAVEKNANDSEEEEEKSRQSSQDSLIPADDHFDSDEESFICVNASGIVSAPCSLNSVDDLVLVNNTHYAAK